MRNMLCVGIRNSGLTIILLLLVWKPLEIQGSSCEDNFELTYSAFGSHTVRSNEDYNVIIFTENVSDPTVESRSPNFFNYTFAVTCYNSNWELGPSFTSTSVVLVPGSIQNVSIPVKDIPNDYNRCYSLQLVAMYTGRNDKIKTVRPINNLNRQTINYNMEQNTTVLMIQTDKPIYKPGDTIKFRVLVLNQRLFPRSEPNVTVVISDSQNNILKKWDNIDRLEGVFSASMAVSSEPNLGTWTIFASSTDSIEEKVTVTVDQYVLPRFKVELKHSNYIYKDAPNVTVEINALYTTGKGLNGSAVIVLEPDSWWGFPPTPQNVSIVDGIGVVEFDVFKLYPGIPNYYTQTFKFLCNVTETLSGISRPVSSSITYYESKFKIEKVDTFQKFIPGLPHLFQIKISDQNNVPISDTTLNSVRVSGCFASSSNSTADQYYTLSADGTVWVECARKSSETYYIYPIISYGNKTETIFDYRYDNYNSGKTDSGVRMQIALSQNNASVGDYLTVYAKTNLPAIRTLNYFLWNNNTFVGEGRLEISEQSIANAAFTFSVPEFVGHSMKIFVFFRELDTQELIQDNLFIFKKQKYITVNTNTTICYPGDTVVLNFKTSKIPSLLAIRAVDQSSFLLTDKNLDITEELAGRKRKLDFNRRNGYDIRSEFTVSNVAVLVDHKTRLKFLEMIEYPQYSSQPGNGFTWGNVGSDAVTVSQKDAHVRSNFPETWIWAEVITNGTNTTLIATAPDTITSWRISSFSLNSENGLQIMKLPHILAVHKEFFVSLNLPYAVIRKKAFALEVYVFSYLEIAVEANVTLDNSNGDYQFVDSLERLQTRVTKTIQIPSNQASAATFVIIPSKIDFITLNVIAKTSTNSDTMQQIVNVIPEGIRKTVTKNIYLDLKSNLTDQPLEHNLTLDFPPFTVKGADQVRIALSGDILGAALENLESLIQQPSGCAEQTLSKFVPDIIIMHYLEKTGRLTPALIQTIIRYLEYGYSNLLRYRHTDGSFSVFGSHSGNGSTWLTALMVKYFVQASKVLTIDEDVIERGIGFLISARNTATGEFRESGQPFYSRLEGGTKGSSTTVTAHVTLALMEYLNERNSSKYPTLAEELQVSLNFISQQSILDSNNTYNIALCAYTLQLANHASKDDFYRKLYQLATETDSATGGKLNTYWKTNADLATVTSPLSIEATSYAALTVLHRGEISLAYPIIKWLLGKRNNIGGFISSQDTLMGITALTAYASKTFVKGMINNMSIKAELKGTSRSFLLAENSDINLQQVTLRNSYKWVKLTARGVGSAFVQITWSYYIAEEDILRNSSNNTTPFTVTTTANKLESGRAVELTVCSKSNFADLTDMAMVEVLLPPSYGFDEEDLQSVLDAENIQRVEIKLGGAKLNVYYNFLRSNDSCFTVTATQNYATADVKLVTIKVYEYNGVAETTVFEKLPHKTVCDVCLENSCDANHCTRRK